MSRSDDLSAFVERPTDIKRLIDFMLQQSPVATKIDPQRIGFFGFSRGGYAGLVLIGANPDWAKVAEVCEKSSSHACDQVRRKEFPPRSLPHDARIKAAVIADPLTIMFSRDSYATITVPVQLWQSERSLYATVLRQALIVCPSTFADAEVCVFGIGARGWNRDRLLFVPAQADNQKLRCCRALRAGWLFLWNVPAYAA